MANKIVLKKSSVAAKVPLSTDLEVGEIAVNLTDQKLYSKKSDGTVILVGSGVSGGGDVVGPASATDNALARFNSTTGKLIQNSTVTLDDNGNTSNVNSIVFDITPTTPATAAGTMYWDAGNQTPSIILNPDVELQLGQENVALVYNGTGSTIPNGAVVAVNGAQGQRPSVALADADNEALSAPTLGIATQSIANGAEGFITTFGFVRGLDTSGFTAGLPIYLSQTAGQFTQTRPAAPAHTVALGWVIKVNASSGEVFVNINNGWELDELHNVLITSPTSGNTLIYDASANVWKNANITAGTGISVTNGAGSITVANTGVTSVGGTGTVNGITLTGTVTTSGNLTLGGTLSGVSLTTQVSGTLPIANGGTNATTAAAALSNLGGFPIVGGTLTTGATNNLFIGRNSTATNYNSISLNGNSADASSMGLTGGGGTDTTLYINAPGQISLRTNSFGQTTTITTSGLQNNESLRAPIFYDSNDTGYYIDPNTTSTAARLRGQIFIGPNSSDRSMRIGGPGGNTDVCTLAASNGNLHIDNQSGYEMYLNYYTNNPTRVYNLRASVMYDMDDTNYYVNPNGYSQFAGIYANNWFRAQGGCGLYFESYGWGLWAPETGGNPYGNVMTYGAGRNGWAGYGMGTRYTLMSNGSGAGMHDNTRGNWSWYYDGTNITFILGEAYASNSFRAPVFYDSNDTGYYIDAAGGSRLNSITVGTGNAYSYVYMRDDEANSGQSSVHANGGLIGFLRGDGGQWYFYCTGAGSYSTTFNATSDYRLKTNLVKYEKDALSIIANLREYEYSLTVNDTQAIGYLAHEVQEIYPTVVVGTKDAVRKDGSIDPQGLDYGKMMPLITVAIKQLMSKITILESQIAALKGN